MNHYRFSKASIIAVILLTLLTCAPKPRLSSTSAASIPLTPTIVSPSPTLPTAGADPVLYFSDITSGPKNGNSDISRGRSGMDGAIVTIWGRNLGSAQGGSRVYANGVKAASYYFWGNAAAPADLHTFHQMQMVSFQINHLAQDGLDSIYVVVNGKTSNALPFTVRAGSIYFVTTGGNDDTGDGSCDCHCDESNQQGCGCCDQHHFQRRYQTKAEQIVELEAYLADLKTEVQAVEERLADLRK